PDHTRVYCAHEYTESNARFAVTVEPGNEALQKRYAAIRAARAKGQPTVPSLLGEEKATNPFLRPMSGNLRETLGLTDADDVAVFAETRRRKDTFRGWGGTRPRSAPLQQHEGSAAGSGQLAHGRAGRFPPPG